MSGSPSADHFLTHFAAPQNASSAAPSTPLRSFGSSSSGSDDSGDDPFIEDVVLSHPLFKDLVIPNHYEIFTNDLSPRMTLSEDFQRILNAFDLMQQKTRKYEDCFSLYQIDRENFKKMIRVMAHVEETDSLSLEQAMIKYGLNNSKALLLAIDLHNKATKKHFPWNEANQPAIRPDQLFTSAGKAIEFVGEDSLFPHYAYAAGLVFDVLRYIAPHFPETKAKTEKMLEVVFEHGMKTAKVGRALATKMGEFKLANFVFASCLVHDIGKVILSMLNPQYFDFVNSLIQKNIPRSARLYSEEKAFGISHVFYSSMAVRHFHLLEKCADVILYHHKPYLLVSEERKDVRKLATFVSLASNISNHFETIDPKDDGAITQFWLRPENRDIDLDKKTIVEIANSVIRKNAS